MATPNVAANVSVGGGDGGAGDQQPPPPIPVDVANQEGQPVPTLEQTVEILVQRTEALGAQRNQDVQTFQAMHTQLLAAIEGLRGQAGGAVNQLNQQAAATAGAAPAATQAAQTAQAAATAATEAARAAVNHQPPPIAPIKTPTPPKFKGVGKEPKILEWTYQATNYLRAVGLEFHEQGVWHITNFLEGDAATWWRLHVTAMEQGVEPRIVAWAALKEMMLGRFQVFNHQVDVRDKYHALEQTGSVADYINSFRALVVELHNEPLENQIYQFLKGLNPEIQSSTRTHKPSSLIQAMDIADEADRANTHARKGEVRMSVDNKGGGGVVSSPDNAVPMQLGAISYAEKQQCFAQGLCFKCRKPGHQARACRSRREARD